MASVARLRRAELVDDPVELAEADRGVLRQLTARMDLAATPDELVAVTRQAIAGATDFDEWDIHRNLDTEVGFEDQWETPVAFVAISRQKRARRYRVFLEECWKDFPGPCMLTLVRR